MTPEQKAIYNKLPEYIMLQPGIHQWKENDEYAVVSGGKLHWLRIDNDSLGEYVDIEYEDIARRPVPDHIREAQAWWILFNKLATVSPDSRDGVMLICRYDHLRNRIVVDTISAVYTRGMQKFENESAVEDAIPILGGEEKIIEMLSAGPGVFEKWLMKQVIKH